MKARLFGFTAVIFLTMAGSSASAQILDPISWSFSKEKTGEREYDLTFAASIESNWHLYGQHLPEGGPIPTSFLFDESTDYERIGEVEEVTKPEVKFDPSFNIDLTMFSHEAVFRQKIRVLSEEGFNISGSIEYMSCDDARCLPPTEKAFQFSFTTTGTGEDVATGGIRPAASQLDLVGSASGGYKETVSTEPVESANASLWVFFLIAFVAGLAGILTPCVFPMIPMTVSFFMQGGENRGKAILKGLIFGISIIAIYTAIGVVVSVSSAGAELTSSLSTHWIPNLIFFILFMVFAASFLGMFELVLPSRWVNSSDKQVDRGGYLGAFFMALTLVLVSFSCTGPIVGALLVEAAGGLALKPILGMFGFSLAFALPFTLFAIFPSWLKGLPKSGGWLNSVKVVLGFIVLAFGMKFLGNIDQTYHLGLMSREVYLAIWMVIFSMLGFYFLGKLRFAHDSDVSHVTVPRLALAIASFTFVLYLLPGLFGANLTSISALIPPKSSQAFDLTLSAGPGAASGNVLPAGGGEALCGSPSYADFLHLPYGLKGYFDYEEGMDCARKKNMPVLLDFKGHACSNCKEMESKVWSDPEVLQRLRHDYIIIALYTDDRTRLPESEWITSGYDGKVKKTLGKKNLDLQISQYQTNTQPFYVLTDTEGNLLAPPRGHNLDVRAFREWLDLGVEHFKGTR
jgi:thiol:disulfide interchange protein